MCAYTDFMISVKSPRDRNVASFKSVCLVFDQYLGIDPQHYRNINPKIT